MIFRCGISIILFALGMYAVYSGRDASAYMAALLVVAFIGHKRS